MSSAPEYALPQRQNVRRRRRRLEDPGPRKRNLEEAELEGGGEGAEEAVGLAAKSAKGEDSASGQGESALPEHKSQAVSGQKFEYLDHTADVQCHAWGVDLKEAFANAGLAMYNYMTPISGIEVDASLARKFEAQGHDMESLLFNFMDELLFDFHTEFFVCKRLEVTRLDRQNWCIEARGEGGKFSREKHECGTEVKAITYSAMQILEGPEEAEVFVIVDI